MIRMGTELVELVATFDYVEDTTSTLLIRENTLTAKELQNNVNFSFDFHFHFIISPRYSIPNRNATVLGIPSPAQSAPSEPNRQSKSY